VIEGIIGEGRFRGVGLKTANMIEPSLDDFFCGPHGASGERSRRRRGARRGYNEGRPGTDAQVPGRGSPAFDVLWLIGAGDPALTSGPNVGVVEHGISYMPLVVDSCMGRVPGS